MTPSVPGLSHREMRYIQRRLAGIGRPFASGDVADDVDLCEAARAVLEAEPDDEELALIARDRDELGYLTVGHIAAILNWVISQEPAFESRRRPARCLACHRALVDELSRRRGYGPVCWERVGHAAKSKHPTARERSQRAPS
jgi:hypothetical protein